MSDSDTTERAAIVMFCLSIKQYKFAIMSEQLEMFNCVIVCRSIPPQKSSTRGGRYHIHGRIVSRPVVGWELKASTHIGELATSEEKTGRLICITSWQCRAPQQWNRLNGDLCIWEPLTPLSEPVPLLFVSQCGISPTMTFGQ